jgi:hypothetical protein
MVRYRDREPRHLLLRVESAAKTNTNNFVLKQLLLCSLQQYASLVFGDALFEREPVLSISRTSEGRFKINNPAILVGPEVSGCPQLKGSWSAPG